MPSITKTAACFAEGKVLLLVEDNSLLRKSLRHPLERMGFTVIEAEDGQQALELFHQHGGRIDLVICDLVMPRLDGWETLKALRELDPKLPVILSSGYDDARLKDGHHKGIFQAFLGKPYTMEELRETILRVLGTPHRPAKTGFPAGPGGP